MERPSLGAQVEWDGDAAVVTDVDPEGIAAVAGIQVGDVITEMGGTLPEEWLRDAPRIGAVRIVLLRNGNRLDCALEFPVPELSASDRGPDPEPQGIDAPQWPKRSYTQLIMGHLAEPAMGAFDRVMEAIWRLARELDRRPDDVVLGVDKVYSSIFKTLNEGDIDPEYINQDALLELVSALNDSATDVVRLVGLMCDTKGPPLEESYVAPAIQHFIEILKMLCRYLNGVKERPASDRRTEFAGFVDRSDIPMMGAMRVISTDPGPLSNIRPPRGPRPMGGSMRWTDPDTGDEIDWEREDSRGYPEEPIKPPRAAAMIDAEIARYKSILAKPDLQNCGWIEKRLKALKLEKLGIASPSPRARPDAGPGNGYDPDKWRKAKWDYVFSHPDAVEEFKPKRFDDFGNPKTHDENGQLYRDQHEWGPAWVIAEAERHATALCGRPDGGAVDSFLRWEAVYGGVESQLRAERGPLAFASNKVWSAHQRWSAMDWASPNPNDPYNPWRR
jgi:hypothetical protein